MQKLLNSRRYFLASTGATATTLLFGQALTAMAQTSGAVVQTLSQPIALDACLELNAVQVAAASPLVQNAKAYLQEQIASIENAQIRGLIAAVYAQPEPTVVQRLSESSKQQLWQELSTKAYTQQSLQAFLPTLPVKQANDVATFTAPGSGYQSHHAYPGGLATHVATNVFITNGIVDSYQKNYSYRVDRDIAVGAL